MELMFKNAMLGAIDTYIRMINDTNDKQSIENEYEYAIVPDTKDFYLYITVEGQEKEIIFSKDEWHGYDKNVLGNKKLKQLHDDLVVS